LWHGGRKKLWSASSGKWLPGKGVYHMQITTSGWLFLIVSWGIIIALNAFCFVKILKENKEKIVDTIDLETKIDEIDPS
jgi:hypothetical protein